MTGEWFQKDILIIIISAERKKAMWHNPNYQMHTSTIYLNIFIYGIRKNLNANC